MTRRLGTRIDRIMRWLHLYTGLFLAPWMLVYGASALCLNHNSWIRERLGIEPPRWEVMRELHSVPPEAAGGAPEDQAEAILRCVGLAGPHRIVGPPNRNQLVVFRFCGGGNYRVTWRRTPSRITIEQQRPFSLLRLLHYLHFRAGYAQPFFPLRAWAIVVDAVAVSLWLWVLSGVYLWARKPSKRALGGVCLAAGSLIFVGLVVLLCM